MNYNAIISLLVHEGIVEYEAGKKLAKELANTIVETNFDAAHKNVEALLERVKKESGVIVNDIEKVVAKKK